MDSYLRRARDADTFTSDGWLRTGDLGYRDEGLLFVTGRRREMVIVRGENYYPGDVEAVVQPLSGIYFGRCVAFAYEAENGERLALLAETALEAHPERAELLERIRASLTRELGLPAVEVRLLQVNSIRRTTNGKTQRLTMRELFIRGELQGEWS
jgi:acyl-CoA synthetase (AMP-forming)/AMP-acid ligase II